MATLGGADLLGADVGLIAPGRSFDALAVRVPEVAVRLVPDRALDEERLVRLTGPGDIVRVWVDGSDVTPASE